MVGMNFFRSGHIFYLTEYHLCLILRRVIPDTRKRKIPLEHEKLKRKVRRVLQQNRRAGQRPVSLHDYGRMLGIHRSQLYMVLNGQKTSARILGLLEMLANGYYGGRRK